MRVWSGCNLSVRALAVAIGAAVSGAAAAQTFQVDSSRSTAVVEHRLLNGTAAALTTISGTLTVQEPTAANPVLVVQLGGLTCGNVQTTVPFSHLRSAEVRTGVLSLSLPAASPISIGATHESDNQWRLAETPLEMAASGSWNHHASGGGCASLESANVPCTLATTLIAVPGARLISGELATIGAERALKLKLRSVAATSTTGWVGYALVDIELVAIASGAPACLADFNANGTADIDDIFLYLNAWFRGDARADVNNNGLNIDDIFLYLNAWFTGC